MLGLPGKAPNNKIPFAAVVIALLLCLPLLAVSPPAKNKPAVDTAYEKIESECAKAGMVDLRRMNAGFVFDVRYATTDNFTHKKLYNQAYCFLRKGTAEKLAAANREFMANGYRLEIYDAYRPYSVQKKLYAVVPSDESYFIADPYKHGSNHNRGCAVDVTLVRLDGSSVEMPTGFDNFSEKARITYDGCSKTEIKDRELLASVMVRHGFERLNCEWWHFDDTDKSRYGLLNIVF